jgi:DNA end-binding protein Ku
MPRSIWSGAISFGLVNVPVKVYSATSTKTVRFHQLDSKTGTRIAQRRVNPVTGDEVRFEDLVKGFELSRDRYVVLTPDELEALAPDKTRTIDIEDFVELAEIDPVYYDHPYWLVPETGASKAYKLLQQAMVEAGKVAIARVVLRNKEHLVALRPSGPGLMMETMHFHDEVVPPEDLDELLATADVTASEREVAMARQLIDTLTTGFAPDRYADTYREKVLGLIERKAAGEEIAVQPEAPAAAPVPDLMAALEASLAEVRKPARKAKPKAPARKGRAAKAA